MNSNSSIFGRGLVLTLVAVLVLLDVHQTLGGWGRFPRGSYLNTYIIRRPAAVTTQRRITFGFIARRRRFWRSQPVSGARFRTRLNGGPWSAFSRTSSRTYYVEPGSYRFEVQARDAQGRIDPTPAMFTVVVQPLIPETRLLRRPSREVESTTPVFTFDAITRQGSRIRRVRAQFRVRMDGDPWSPFTDNRLQRYTDLAPGFHTFQVQARGSDGGLDPTPASWSFQLLDRIPPQTRNVVVRAIEEQEATITWTTDESATGQMRYWTAGEELCTVNERRFTTSHSLTLRDLHPATPYSFQVISTDQAGNSSQAVPGTFTTRDPAGDYTAPQVVLNECPDPGQRLLGTSVVLAWYGTDNRTPAEELVYELTLTPADGSAPVQQHNFDRDWIRFTALSPGQWTFQIQTQDRAGNLSPLQSVTFEVAPEPSPVHYTDAVLFPDAKPEHQVHKRAYYDNLGRLTQVRHEWDSLGTPQTRVEAQQYDAWGRVIRSYVPYGENSSGQTYTRFSDVAAKASSWYNGEQGPDAAGFPFTTTVYEANPLGRIKRVQAPGAVYHRHGHWISMRYFSQIDEDTAGYLAVTESSNENGRVSQSWTDALGQVRKTVVDPGGLNLVTRRVYDALGRLTRVIPPLGPEAATGFGYDTRGRLIEKRTADGDTIRYLYDRTDDLRLVQDGNHRQGPLQWLYYKYDHLHRLIETGELADRRSVSMLQKAIDDDPAFPTNPTIIRVRRQYDRKPVWGEEPWGRPPESFAFTNLSGRIAAVAYHLADGVYGRDFYSYDEDGNLTALVKVIPGLEPKRMYYRYDRLGRVLTFQYQPGQPDAFAQRFTYHPGGQLKAVYARLGDAPERLEARYSYWPSGQVRRVELGSTPEGPLRVLDYTYTARGWLKAINGEETSRPGQEDLFRQALGYDQRGTLTSSAEWQPQYNGNVSWQTITTPDQNGALTTRGTLYRYDPASRLLEADSKVKQNNHWLETTAYDMIGLGYDPNGNIQGFIRYDQEGRAVWLDYQYGGSHGDHTYSPNQLGWVGGDLGQSQGNYRYDRNGNLIFDQARGVRFHYDYRNLPLQAQFLRPGPVRRIGYQYDASGQRIKKRVVQTPGQ